MTKSSLIEDVDKTVLTLREPVSVKLPSAAVAVVGPEAPAVSLIFWAALPDPENRPDKSDPTVEKSDSADVADVMIVVLSVLLTTARAALNAFATSVAIVPQVAPKALVSVAALLVRASFLLLL